MRWLPRAILTANPSARFFRYSHAGSLVKASRRSAAASSSVMFLASGTMLSKTAPRTIRRWLRVLRSSLGIASDATSFPGSQTAGFSSFRPQSRLAVLRGFSLLVSSCGGRSFLLIGIEKEQSLFSAALCRRYSVL